MPKWKVFKRYVLRSSKDPESLARGLGLGFFIGFLPSFGFQILLAFFLAGFFNANRIIAMAGTLVTNPLTALPLSVLSVWIGDLILPGATLHHLSDVQLEFSQIWNSSIQLGMAYLVGCLALSVMTGAAAYGLAKLYFATRLRPKDLSL